MHSSRVHDDVPLIEAGCPEPDRIEVYKNKVQCATTYALAGTLRCSLTAEIVISGTHFVLICCRRMLAALQNRALGLGAAANLSVGQLDL